MNSMNIHVSILSSVVFCCESETLHEMQCKGNNSCVLLQNGSLFLRRKLHNVRLEVLFI